MVSISPNLLTNSRNRPFLRDAKTYAIRQLKGIVAHWTANTRKGADAKANRNYFNTTDRFASAHYIVDDKSIVQCIPDNEVAYHVGAIRYKPDGDRIIGASNLTPNYFLVGFEMCVNEDGNWNKTYQNAVELAAHLLRKYRFTTFDLYRHFDITGKDCPKMMLTDSVWDKFKNDIAQAMGDDPALPLAQGRVTSSELNVRSGPGTSNAVLRKLKKDDAVNVFEENDGWLRIGNRQWVSKTYVEQTFQTILGRIKEATGANVRSGPGTSFPVVDALPNGAIIDLLNQNGNWFEIADKHWLHNSLVDILRLRSGEVIGTDSLNVRAGADTSYPIVRRLKRGSRVQIFDQQDQWLRIGNSEWVFSSFVQIR